jgi:hypothetical protein
MNVSLLYEMVGYCASVLVAISLMMSSIIKLRIINLIGAMIFSAYGFLIVSYPVAFVNLFIAGVNVYYLYTIYSAKEYFRIMETPSESEYLRHFLEFYGDDIKAFNPEYRHETTAAQKVYFVLRNMIPAGLLILDRTGDDEASVQLDFVIPGYRDFKIGKFIYQDKKHIFTDSGIRRITAPSGSDNQMKYLEKMGFRRTEIPGKGVRYMLDLT